MGTIASQITSLTIVYTTVYSDADQSNHQSSASLAFVWGIHRGRWIPRTKGQLRGKCFHLMTSSWFALCCVLLWLDSGNHCSDVIMSTKASQITGSWWFAQPFVQAQIQENIKALRHCPLWGESTGDRWFPSQRASDGENVSIWWRHHVLLISSGVTSLVLGQFSRCPVVTRNYMCE